MKVTMIVTRFLPAKGGIISQVAYLTNALVRQGIEVEIHTGNTIFIGNKRVLLPFSNLKLDNLGIVVERDLLPIAPLHVRLVKNPKDSDILNIHGHAELFTISTLLQLSKVHKPIVLTTHCALISSLLGLSHKVKNGRTINSIESSLKRALASKLTINLIKRYVEMIITPTEVEREVLASNSIPPYKIIIIRNFVPDSYFLLRHECNYILKHYDFVPYEYILTVARIDYNKGLDQVIKAIAILREQGINIKYVIVGPDEGALNYYLTLAKKVNIKSNIIYLGAITSKRVLLNLMKYSLAFVLPSYVEGAPIAVLEAMSQASPVIMSDTANFISRTVQHMFNGLVFNYGNIQSLVQAIRMLLEDENLRKKLGKNTFKYAYEHHRLSKAVDKYVKIFKTLYEIYHS